MHSHELIRPQVLPGSLYPSMVHTGVAARNGVKLRNGVLSEMPISSSGQLLLPPRVAEIGHRVELQYLQSIGALGWRGARAYMRAEVDSVSGCLRTDVSTATGNIGKYITHLYSLMSLPVLDSPIEVEANRMCDCESCLNIRHYDVEFWASTRTRRVDLAAYNYRAVSLGDRDVIMTSWGDVLPSSYESRALYESFRATCFPYVSHADSPLTIGAVASIKFIPLTGCFAGDSYYRGDFIESLEGSFQNDGYANLYHKGAKQKSGAQQKAHREIWELLTSPGKGGNFINHLCGYRRCCNPLHLENTTPRKNSRHGIIMTRASRELYQMNPEQREAFWYYLISEMVNS